MVVNVYVEGGIINGNVDASTNNNSEALREELNRFMQRALHRDDISIVVKKCSGYKEAAKQFQSRLTCQILLKSLIFRYQFPTMVLALTIPDLESSVSCFM